VLVLLLAAARICAAAPGDVLFSDDFEDGNLAPWTNNGVNYSVDVNQATSQSGSYSLALNGGTGGTDGGGPVVSPTIDAAVPAADVTMWIRRGDDSFSEDPDSGEDLVVQYLDDAGNWQTFSGGTFPGAGTPGEVFTPNFTLPANALHSGLQLRLRRTGGNACFYANYCYDYWHVDDVVVTERGGPFVGTGTGLTGDYCNRGNGNYDMPCDANPDVTRIDSTVDFNDGDAGWPASGIDNQTFSVRWTGQIQAQYTEDYQIHTISDDGVRVWLDGNLIIDDYNDHSAREDISNAISLVRGQRYDITIEYYEHFGQHDARLLWSSPSTAPSTAPVVVPQTQLYPTSGIAGNLLADYWMDAFSWSGTSGEVVDSSGNGRNGTAVNGAQTSQSTPAIAGDPGTCGYATFDGTDDYVQVNNLSDILSGTASLSFWIKTTQSGNDTDWQAPGVAGVELAGGTDDIFWGWIDAGDHIGVTVGDDQNPKSTVAINDGTWHHVVLTRNAGTGDYRIYIDGSLNRSGTTTAGTIGTAFSSIGRIEDTAGTPTYFRGQLDEVRVYDSVLGQTDVQALYTATHPCQGSGAVAEYRMDAAQWTGGSGEVIDSSGNGHDGTPNGGLSTTPAKVCYGGDFQGGGGYVDVPDADALSPLLTDGALTLTGWVKRNPGGTGTIIHKGFNTTSDEYRIYIDGGGALNATLWGRNNTPYSMQVGGMAADQWYFFALTANRPGGNRINAELRLYTDSGLVGSDSLTNNTNTFFVQYGNRVFSSDLYLGAFGDPNVHDYLDGVLDEVRIHDRALSTSEILTLRDTTRPCAPIVDHFEISHDGAGINCRAEPVTIRAVDAVGNTVTSYTGSVDLSTSTANGDWSVNAAGGSLSSGGGDDGAATYTFVSSDNGQVMLNLRDTHKESVNVGVADGTAVDDDTEGDIVFRPYGFEITPNPMPTQIAGRPFDVTVTAVGQLPSDPSCGVIEEYTGAQSVNFWFDYEDPGTGTSQVSVDGTAIAASEAGSTAQSVTFSNGVATLQTVYPDAGRIQLHARDDNGIGEPPDTTGDEVVGGGAPFVVRPFGFHVWVDGNPGASSAAGAAFVAAGADFVTHAQAVAWQAADDTDNDGVPDGFADNDPGNNADLSDNAATPNYGRESSPEAIALSSYLVLPTGAGTVDPGLSGSTQIAPGGGDQTTNQFTEVGIVGIQANVADGDYLGTGGADPRGASGYVGRFYPASFDVSITQPLFSPACGSFTYLGQPFLFVTPPSVTITAVNTAGNQTHNYTGNFWRLGSALSQKGSGSYGFEYTDQTGVTPLQGPTSPAPFTTTAWDPTSVHGKVSFTLHGDPTDEFVYQRPGAAAAPFDGDVRLQIDVDDGDATGTGAVSHIGFNGESDPVTSLNATNDRFLRYGRLSVGNAYGSERLPLDMPLYAEYYDGNGFVTNQADACTTYAASGASFANLSGLTASDIAAYHSGTLTGGRADPANPLTVADDASSTDGPGKDGSVDVVLSVPAYLQFDWDTGAAGLENPRGRATFGIYRGSDSVIYSRELY